MAAKPDLLDLAREARLPRDLVLAARAGAQAEDLRDCASRLSRFGRTAPADLLLDVANLANGRSDSLQMRGDGPAWEVAIGELSNLIHVAEQHGSPLPEASAPVATPPDRAWLATVFPSALKRLLGLRDNTAQVLAPDDESGALMDGIAHFAAFDFVALRQEPCELASAVAFNVTRRILIGRIQLARGPFGSIALFRTSEELQAKGLGLGFANLVSLASTWRDIAVLITEAWREQPRAETLAATMDRFGVLLTLGLPPPALRVSIDELADAGEFQILEGILGVLRSRPRDLIDLEATRTLRDAFLDLGSMPLAIAAQGMLTAATGNAPAELVAQGELKTSSRRSGFASAETQRRRRFPHALARRAREPIPVAGS